MIVKCSQKFSRGYNSFITFIKLFSTNRSKSVASFERRIAYLYNTSCIGKSNLLCNRIKIVIKSTQPLPIYTYIAAVRKKSAIAV